MRFVVHRLFFILLIISVALYAYSEDNMAEVCAQLKLIPASKAVVQWERVFSSEKRMKRYAIDQLSHDVQNKLKVYLIDHAADSSQPMVPGL